MKKYKFTGVTEVLFETVIEADSEDDAIMLARKIDLPEWKKVSDYGMFLEIRDYEEVA